MPETERMRSALLKSIENEHLNPCPLEYLNLFFPPKSGRIFEKPERDRKNDEHRRHGGQRRVQVK